MKKFLIIVFSILVLLVGLIFITGNQHLFKAVASTYLVGKTGPTIDDYSKFENRIVQGGKPQEWAVSENYNEFELSADQIDSLEKYKTIAFLVIYRDSILYEKYWENYTKESLTNSFSVAKTLVGIAIGVALKDGSIKSLDQKVGEFLPEFQEGKKSKISIRDLLTMSSGIDFGESYNDPFGFMAKTYYGKTLYNLTVEKEIAHPAGEVWKYQGGNTLLLSFILKKATGKNLSEYFSEKIWQPIGASENALWTVNRKNGLEKSYCCFYSNARDFARIGKLYLQDGVWKGDTLVPEWYVRESVLPVNIPTEEGKNVDYYGFQWWLTKYDQEKIFYARGIQGQYIVVIPNKNLILVRLGRERHPARGAVVPKDLLIYLDIGSKIAKDNIERPLKL